MTGNPSSPNLLNSPPSRGPGVRRLNRVPLFIAMAILAIIAATIAYTYWLRLQHREAGSNGGANRQIRSRSHGRPRRGLHPAQGGRGHPCAGAAARPGPTGAAAAGAGGPEQGRVAALSRSRRTDPGRARTARPASGRVAHQASGRPRTAERQRSNRARRLGAGVGVRSIREAGERETGAARRRRGAGPRSQPAG